MYQCRLSNDVSHYALSILSMSAMGFQQIDREVGGWCGLYRVFWDFVNFAKQFILIHTFYILYTIYYYTLTSSQIIIV